MSAYEQWLDETRAARERAGLRRGLVARSPVDGVLDLASNDYLGLARDPRVVAAATEALQKWGAGATGSRLVTGTTELHGELERELAAFGDAEAGLVFSSGYAANLGVLQALADEDTLIVSDRGNHASLIDGCRLARGRVAVVPHQDVAAVDSALVSRREKRAMVVTDAVFSIDGDVAPLRELHGVARRHDALLVVDEAHALGVVGPRGAGVSAAEGIAHEPDVVRTVTLSKSLGAQGGAVIGTAAIVEHLVDTARMFIFDTGLAPASTAAALAALRILSIDEPHRADDARRRAAQLAAGLDMPEPATAIVPLVVGDPLAAYAAATRCRADGVLVGCFRPPSVPAGTSRLRLAARADLTDADLGRAVEVVARSLR